MVVLAVGFLDLLTADAISTSTAYTSLKKIRQKREKEIINESST